MVTGGNGVRAKQALATPVVMDCLFPIFTRTKRCTKVGVGIVFNLKITRPDLVIAIVIRLGELKSKAPRKHPQS